MYIAKIQTTVAGIPAIIGVTGYENSKPDRRCHDSDMDYNGFIDIEFAILDRKGYPAPWLEKKLTAATTEQVEEQIIDYFSEEF